MKIPNLKLILTLRCEAASQLASESLDRELTAAERWALRVHALVCRPCRRLIRQLRSIRVLVTKMPATVRDASRGSITRLSPERRHEIKRLLHEAQRLQSN